MPLLHFALEEGFTGEPVRIQVDGQVVLDRTDVKSRPETGLAALCETPQTVGDHTIEVSLPGRDLQKTVRVAVCRDTFVAFSVEEQGLTEPRISHDPFFYA